MFLKAFHPMTRSAMNTDLTMLTASALLTGLLVMGKGVAMLLHWPPREFLGNRGDVPPLPPWAGRADRAHRNMIENFVHFAAFVLIVNQAGLADRQTALGATIFFWARLAHALIYISGVWRLRTIAYFAGVAGELLIVLRLLTAAPWHLLIS
jgi:uncharacterized MAPEG superfamily protein